MGKDKDKIKEKGGAVAAGGSSSAVDRTDFAIAPSSSTPPLDTSKWPLLLKNYDKVFIVRATLFVPAAHALLAR